ncbi:MAG: acetyl-CoA carboxylase biotin carboxyl carrier protein, partial [Thermomicrobiales bacterium]
MGSVSVRLRRPAFDAELEGEIVTGLGNDTPQGSVAAGHVITAPMIGTFYTAPTPGALPFVREGDEVVVGQTIGIIEAMKIMNEITADRTGTVAGLLVGNGQPVEYGSPLMRLALPRSERS